LPSAGLGLPPSVDFLGAKAHQPARRAVHLVERRMELAALDYADLQDV
jgi:hypothetical protein